MDKSIQQIPSSEIQGLVSCGGGGGRGGEGKHFGRRKVKNAKKTLVPVLDFSSPAFLSRPFRLFLAPLTGPWVSEDVQIPNHTKQEVGCQSDLLSLGRNQKSWAEPSP